MKAVPITNTDRADVLRMTWALMREAKIKFADALKRAWTTVRMKIQMSYKAVGFFYRKENGEVRYALGYNAAAPRPATDKPATKPGPLVVRYYDLTCDNWRSFRADRLIID